MMQQAQLIPTSHGQALTAQLLAANARPAMGPINTVQPMQIRSQGVNFLDEVQKERAFNRDFYRQQDQQNASIALEAQRNAYALNQEKIKDENAFKRLEKENEFRLGQLEKGNEYSLGQIEKQNENQQAMFGITKEHQLAMEGLRKSNNIEVQKAAQEFETKMASITRNFQISREQVGFDKAKELYKQQRQDALDDFKKMLEEKGQFQSIQRYWDSLADKSKIDYQLESWKKQEEYKENQFNRQRQTLIGDSQSAREMAGVAFQRLNEWNQGDAAIEFTQNFANMLRKQMGPIVPGSDDEKKFYQQLNSAVLNEKLRRENDASFYMKNMPAGGAIAPSPKAPQQTVTPRARMLYNQLMQKVANPITAPSLQNAFPNPPPAP
jgi:hypothetical protein